MARHIAEQFPISALGDLPQVDPSAVALGRSICTMTFFIEGHWQVWFPAGDRLYNMKPIGLAEGLYFGDRQAEPRDLRLMTLEIIGQFACFTNTMDPFKGICDDLYNIAASIAKLDLITKHQADMLDTANRMVLTEVEYLAIQCRGIFDYLQKILKAICATVTFHDGTPPIKPLPESFREVVMVNNQLRTAQDIQEKYRIFPAVAETYAKHADFFKSIRTMRDAIIHEAGSPPLIFMTPRGPCIQADFWPFSTMLEWRRDEYQPNNIVPIKPALGAMIFRTILAAEELINAFARSVNLGPPVCPNLGLFLRCSSGASLMELMMDAHQRLAEPLGISPIRTEAPSSYEPPGAPLDPLS